MSTNGDWYCRNCGYISAPRVTHAETCNTCHTPAEWHDAKQQTALAAAQAEVTRLTRAVECVNESANELIRERDAAQAEARELREKLGRVRELVPHWRMLARGYAYEHITEEEEGRRDGYSRSADDLDAAVSQPAAEPVAVIRQYYFKRHGCTAANAHDPDCICWHDEGTGPLADGEYVKSWRVKPTEHDLPTTGKPGLQVEPATSSAGELPIMARREWMHQYAEVANFENGVLWIGHSSAGSGVYSWYCPKVLFAGTRNGSFRIADTDEHDLPVVVRTADMPTNSRYCCPSVPVWHFSDLPSWAKLKSGCWVRIEDFRDPTCTAPLPCESCDGGCVGEESAS